MRLPFNITTKLTLLFVLFAALLVAVVGTLAYYDGRRALEAATTSALLSTAIEKESALNTWVDDRQLDIVALANAPHLTEHVAELLDAAPESAPAQAAHDRLVRDLQTWAGPGQQYLSLLVIEAETGQVIAATDPQEAGTSKADRPYFSNGLNGPYVQDLYLSPTRQELAMTAAAPLRSSQGELLAVLAGRLNLVELNDIVSRRTGLHQTDDSFLVNEAGLFVTQPRFLSEPVVLRRQVGSEAATRCLAGSSGIVSTLDYRQVPAEIVYRWLPGRRLCLIVKTDQAEALAPSRAFGQSVLLIGGLALLVASGLAFLLARTITGPVKQLMAGAQAIGAGQLDTRLAVKTGDELEQLATAFTQMAADLKKTLVSREDLLKEVAERKQAEKTLRESEERYHSLFRNNHSAMLLIDPDTGAIIDANPGACDFYGYSHAEITGLKISDVNQLTPEQVFAEMEQAKQEQRNQFFFRHRLASGEVREVEVYSGPIEFHGRTMLYSIVHDISERRQAERANRLKDELLHLTGEMAKVGGWEFDATTRQGTWTDEVARIHDLEPGQETNVDLGLSFYPPEARAKIEQAIREALELARPYDLEVEMVSAAGQTKCVRTMGVPIVEEGRVIKVRGIFQDISERKRSEEALRTSEQKLRTLFDLMPAGISILDQERRIVETNPALERILGLSRESLAAGTYVQRDYLRADGSPFPLAEFPTAQVLKTQQPVLNVEIGVVKEDSEIIWTNVSAIPLAFADWRVFTVISDITQRKQAEEQFRLVVEASPNAIMLVDAAGQINLVNRQAEVLFGYPRPELLDQAVETLVPGQFRAQHLRDREAFFAEPSARLMGAGRDLFGLRRDGRQVPVEIGLSPITTSEGFFVLATIIDITQRKQAEAAIHQLNAELEQRVAERTAELSDLYNNAPCGYHSLDAEGRFVRINDTELHWLGYSREEIVGKMKATDLFTPASVKTFKENFPLLKTHGWLENLELDMVRKDGSVLPVLLSATAVFDQAGDFLMSRSTMIDYADRKRAEAALRESQTRLQAANKELEAFAYSVSHDLRAPLRGIDGFSQALLEDYHDALDAEGQRYLQRVRAASQRMAELIDDLLTLSRITRSEMYRERVDLSELARTVIEAMRQAEPARQVAVDIAPHLVAWADRRLLRAALENLLGNAWKFTSKQPQARIELGTLDQAGQTVYMVRDNGAGFDMAYAEKLFAAFQRLHTPAEFSGSGIGLATVQRIIHRHGGRIWAEGVVDEGATFYFTLAEDYDERRIDRE